MRRRRVTAEASAAPGTDGSTAEDSRKGPLRWLLLLLLAIVLIAAIVLGFRGLGTLTSQFTSEGAPEQTAAPADPSGSPSASAAPSAAAAPDVASASRLTSDPNFMADTDATLNQATDGNPATYWLSYGFSSAQFGNLADSVGLAVQLKEPATAQELTIQQADGSGGQFTVYVSDQPSLEGAQEVGKGSFTGPEATGSSPSTLTSRGLASKFNSPLSVPGPAYACPTPAPPPLPGFSQYVVARHRRRPA